MKGKLCIYIGTLFCCIFFLMSGVIWGAQDWIDNPYVKQVEITRVDRDHNEQSTLVKVIFNSLPESVESLVDQMEFQDSNGEVYQFYPEEFQSTDLCDFYLKELPFSIPDGEIKFTLYDGEGVKCESLMQHPKDRTVQSSPATYDGEWSGTTNQAYDVSFTVSDNSVTNFKIKSRISGSYCSVTVEQDISATPSWPISGNSFTITGESFGTYGKEHKYEGTFNSDTTASGTWYFKDNYCKGSGSGTWQASLKGSEPPAGAMVTSNLWIGAFINTEEKGPIEAVWKKGGEDTTSRGDRVIWGHFYASPNDVTWGSENNPDLFVKIWFDVSGRIDVNYFHVSVPDIEVYSDYPCDGTTDQHGTTTMSRRYIRQYYEGGQSYSDENYEDGNPPSGYSPAGNPSGYSTINDLRIGSMINTVEKGPIDAVWRLGGQDTTARGDQVVWGLFYASPTDVTWGSSNNPDLFVKIWFDVDGRVDVNYFHVSVPDIEVYSDLPSDGTYDQKGTTIMNNRYIRHEYWRTPLTCSDTDSDGYYSEDGCGTAVDCNDNDASIYPGATEICGDGIDQDCNGSDEMCSGATLIVINNFYLTQTIYLDGTNIGSVSPNQTLRFSISPGDHTVSACDTTYGCLDVSRTTVSGDEWTVTIASGIINSLTGNYQKMGKIFIEP